MAKTALPASTTVTFAGVADVAGTACDNSNGNSLPNTPGLHLIFKNTGGTTATVTFVSNAVFDGITVTPPVLSIAAGATVHVGGLPSAVYGSQIQFTASAATVTVATYVAPATN